MNRKIVFLTLTLIMILMLAFMIINKDDTSYINVQYDYTLSPPDYWKNNYFISTMEGVDFYTKINFRSKSLSEEAGEDKGPTIFVIYAVPEKYYLEKKDEPRFSNSGPYIKHPTKDIGLWVIYRDQHAPKEEQELHIKMIKDVSVNEISKYLYFNDTK